MKNARMRLVSVRMSENEYRSLKNLCDRQGCRSISGFVRSSLTWIVASSENSLWELLISAECNLEEREVSDRVSITQLAQRVSELNRELERLRRSMRSEGIELTPAGSQRSSLGEGDNEEGDEHEFESK